MWFKQKNDLAKDLEQFETKELEWTDEKIIQTRVNGTVREMYYQNIIRVEIICFDSFLPVPKWVIQDDSDYRTIEIPNDFKPEFMDLVIGMFNKKLEGYDNDNVHKKIIEAMGSTLGFFQLWSRSDIEEVLEKMRKRNKPIRDAEFDLIIEQHKQKEANVWWRKVLRFLKLIK